MESFEAVGPLRLATNHHLQIAYSILDPRPSTVPSACGKYLQLARLQRIRRARPNW